MEENGAAFLFCCFPPRNRETSCNFLQFYHPPHPILKGHTFATKKNTVYACNLHVFAVGELILAAEPMVERRKANVEQR